MKSILICLLLPLAAASCVAAQSHPIQPGPAGSLDRKIAAALPTAAEDRWLKIPWRANVMEARTEAQRQGKPVFLWVMDGNPLGCG